MDCEPPVDADALAEHPQQPRADPVERAAPHVTSDVLLAQHIGHSLKHFVGRAAGEREQQDAMSRYAFRYQVSHTVHESRCLSGSGAGDDQQRFAAMHRGGLLLLVQVGKYSRHICRYLDGRLLRFRFLFRSPLLTSRLFRSRPFGPFRPCRPFSRHISHLFLISLVDKLTQIFITGKTTVGAFTSCFKAPIDTNHFRGRPVFQVKRTCFAAARSSGHQISHVGQPADRFRPVPDLWRRIQQRPRQEHDALRAGTGNGDVQPVQPVDKLGFLHGELRIGHAVADDHGIRFLSLHLVDRIDERRMLPHSLTPQFALDQPNLGPVRTDQEHAVAEKVVVVSIELPAGFPQRAAQPGNELGDELGFQLIFAGGPHAVEDDDRERALWIEARFDERIETTFGQQVQPPRGDRFIKRPIVATVEQSRREARQHVVHAEVFRELKWGRFAICHGRLRTCPTTPQDCFKHRSVQHGLTFGRIGIDAFDDRRKLQMIASQYQAADAARQADRHRRFGHADLRRFVDHHQIEFGQFVVRLQARVGRRSDHRTCLPRQPLGEFRLLDHVRRQLIVAVPCFDFGNLNLVGHTERVFQRNHFA